MGTIRKDVVEKSGDQNAIEPIGIMLSMLGIMLSLLGIMLTLEVKTCSIALVHLNCLFSKLKMNNVQDLYLNPPALAAE